MAQLENSSFRTLLKECKNICIPEIQRDYAQGRMNEQSEKIRNGFITSLLPVFEGTEEIVSLDFIYGYQKDGAFEPLDGQQRLTTLFLIHWLFCPEDCDELKSDDKSRFRYTTRISSGAFCDALVKQSAAKLVGSWKREYQEKGIKFSVFLQDLDWFEWTWRYDPTIMAMTNMLDTILEILEENNINFCLVSYDKLDHIVFHRLYLGGAVFKRMECDDLEFKLGEDLYVKMNARGKELSEFDKLKSTLEEELQLQKDEGLIDDKTEAEWRTYMDGTWADYFWQTKTTDSEDAQKVVLDVEDKFRIFLSRVIAFNLADQFEESQKDNDVYFSKNWTDLQALCLSTEDSVIGTVVDKYVVAIHLARFHERQNKSEESKTKVIRIDFNRIINDMKFLFHKIGENVHDVTHIACPELKWEPGDSSYSMLRDFIDKGPSHDRRIEYYAILAFIRNVNVENLSQSNKLKKDLCDWMRFIRNCSLSRNLNQQIDKPEKERQARKFIFEKIVFFADKANSDQSFSIRQFITELGEKNVGLEDSSIAEEKVKAGLKENIDWEENLNAAENNEYLWGQLRAPLYWSQCVDKGNYDLKQFKTYIERLQQIFPVKDGSKDKFWKALLCIRDYRFTSGDKIKTLITFDNDRDVSWKRYMREKSDQNLLYAPVLKEFIDRWLIEKPELGFEDFLDWLINISISDNSIFLEDKWRKYVISIDGLCTHYCKQKGLLVDDYGTGITGHKWFFPKTQVGESRRAYELFITYLQYCRKNEGVNIDFVGDSIVPDAAQQNCIRFRRKISDGNSYNETVVDIQAIRGGMYRCRVDDNVSELTDDQVLERLRIENIIK